MSLHQFQSALAQLIRLPDHNRGQDTGPFLDRFELTPSERQRLELLACDPKVRKYGLSMAGVRWETPQQQLRIARKLMPESALELLYRTVFEPEGTKVSLHDLTDRFLGCLIENPKAREVLRESAPAYIDDVFRFERIQLKFFRGNINLESSPAPQGSLLRHTAFRILDLSYDLPGFLLSLEEDPTGETLKNGPEPRPITVLFIPDEAAPGPRYFEIDGSVRAFLQALADDPLATPGLPESYTDLVELKLCQPLC